MTLDGFYMDLMMNRGSDPAKSKSTLGADHLAVKEVNTTSSQVAGHHTVIASIEEEGDPRIVWCGHRLAKVSGTRNTPCLATCQPLCECSQTIPPSPSIIHTSDEELGCCRHFCWEFFAQMPKFQAQRHFS